MREGDLISLQINVHVRKASGRAHRHQRRAADDPEDGEPAADEYAHEQESEDDREELHPRSPSEQMFPGPEAPLDARLHDMAETPKHQADQADPEQHPGG